MSTTSLFQNGVYPTAAYAGSADGSMAANHVTWNYGTTAYCELNASGGGGFWKRTLMSFDISSIPATEIIVSASLFFTSRSGSAAGNIVGVYAGLNAWVEGTMNAAQAGANEPCWNAREADGAGGVTTAWGAAGGLAGTDYVAVAEGTVETVADATEYTVPLSTTLVQNWVTTPANNFGLWLLRTEANAASSIYSNNDAGAGNHPMLKVVHAAQTMTPCIMML